MTRPRLSIRTLILVVAALAVLMALVARGWKRQRLRYLGDLVARYAEREAYWSDQEEAMRRYEGRDLAAGRTFSAAVSASQALYDRDQAQYFGSLRRKYEGALRRPDRAIEPDPVPPYLYPRDYLPKVPYHVPDRGPGEGPTP